MSTPALCLQCDGLAAENARLRSAELEAKQEVKQMTLHRHHLYVKLEEHQQEVVRLREELIGLKSQLHSTEQALVQVHSGHKRRGDRPSTATGKRKAAKCD